MPMPLSPRFWSTELRRLALLTLPHLGVLAVVILFRQTGVFWKALGLLGFMIAVSVREIAATCQRIRHIPILAREGSIEIVRLTRSVRAEGWLGARIRYWYDLPHGGSRTSSLPFSEGGAFRFAAEDGSQDRALCLCTSDRRTTFLLSLSGYPLAHLPAKRNEVTR